jgi:hypothetical protein
MNRNKTLAELLGIYGRGMNLGGIEEERGFFDQESFSPDRNLCRVAGSQQFKRGLRKVTREPAPGLEAFSSRYS